MMARKQSEFWNTLKDNANGYLQYYYMLMELSLSMFKWTGLPDTIDSRFLEMTLFGEGKAIFFRDDVLGYLALQCMAGGPLSVYRVPTMRRAYASNGYQNKLTPNDSVIIYNNMIRTPSWMIIMQFAKRLWNMDRTVDVNINAQKTPILVLCDENERLSMLQIYQKYQGTEPVIFGQKGLSTNAFKTLNTGAPYVADRVNTLKVDVWNEALTYLGISNVSMQKKERMVTDEVNRSMGGTLAARYSRLNMRQQACEEINKMFGLDIWCEYRTEVDDMITSTGPRIDEGEQNVEPASESGDDK